MPHERLGHTARVFERGLDSYQSQVHDLENEYQLVTSLQLHPRIIQFFAIVRDDNNARVVIIMEFLEGGSQDLKKWKLKRDIKFKIFRTTI